MSNALTRGSRATSRQPLPGRSVHSQSHRTGNVPDPVLCQEMAMAGHTGSYQQRDQMGPAHLRRQFAGLREERMEAMMERMARGH